MDRDFERIVNSYADMLFRICMNYSQSTADGEDIVQQTFLKILEKNIIFENPEHEKAWLIRVCINLCKDNLKNSRNKNIHTEAEDICHTDRHIEKLYITDLVRTLPPKQKLAIFLHYYEGMPVKEIAVVMEEKTNTVLSHLARGRKALEKKIKEEL